MLFLLTHFVTMFSLCEWLNKANNISEQIIGQTLTSKAPNKLPQTPSWSQKDVGELFWMRSAQHKIFSPQVVPSASKRNKQHRPVATMCCGTGIRLVFYSYSCGYLGSLNMRCFLVTFTSHPYRRQSADFSGLVIVYRSEIRLLFTSHPNSSHQKEWTFC